MERESEGKGGIMTVGGGRWDAVFERARRTVEGWSPAKRAWARRATTPRASDEAPCPSRDACHEAQTCLGNCRVHDQSAAPTA